MNKWTADIEERYGGDAGKRDHRRDHRSVYKHPKYRKRRHEEVRQECRLIASTSTHIRKQKTASAEQKQQNKKQMKGQVRTKLPKQ